jgi:CHAD domain-containing protein
VPDEAADLVTAFIRSGSLDPVATLHTTRIRWELKSSDERLLAVLADDEVSLLDGMDVRARFREVELETVELSLKKMTRVGQELWAAGAMRAEPIPKAVRALGPRATAPPDVAPVEPPGPKSPTGEVVKASLANGLFRLVKNDPLARLGHAEGVHQMRVAARRMRSDLRTFERFVDVGWAEELTKELKWLGERLGEVRDLDVLQTKLAEAAEGLGDEIKPLFHILAQRETDARRRMSEALRSARYTTLLDRLVDAARLPALSAEASAPAAKKLRKAVEPIWKDVKKKTKALGPGDPPRKWHKVRIRVKRARYAAEAVAPSLGPDGSDAARFARAAAKVQDVLGAQQDAVVATEIIREIAAEHQGNTEFTLAAGRLLERQERARDSALDGWPKAWKRLSRTKNTRWLGV